MDAVGTNETMIIYSGHNHNGGEFLTGSEEAYIVQLDDYSTWSLTSGEWMDDEATEDNRVQIIDWNDTNISVQTGTHTFLSTDTTATITPGTAVDHTRTLLFVTYRREVGGVESSPNIDQFLFSATLNTSGNIDLFRYTTGPEDHFLYWQLIEFPATFLAVQHKIEEMAFLEKSKTVLIDEIVLDKSIAVGTIGTFYGWGWGATSGFGAIGEAAFTVDLLYSTVVELASKGNNEGTLKAGFQVAQFHPGSVNHAVFFGANF
jgi:hypothetical protein